MIAWQPAGEASIPARLQPALALEYGRSREAFDADLLRDTGLAALAPDGLVSPAQYLQQLSNTVRVLGSPDTSFMLGSCCCRGTTARPAMRWCRRRTCGSCSKPYAITMRG